MTYSRLSEELQIKIAQKYMEDSKKARSKMTRLRELNLITEGIIEHVIKTQPRDLLISISQYLEKLLRARDAVE